MGVVNQLAEDCDGIGFGRVRAIHLARVCLLVFVLIHGQLAAQTRIANDPYRNVHWQTDFRLKAQFHDHVETNTGRIAAYDRAGYDALALLHYSGSQLSASWKERRWPPEDWLPADFLASLNHIDFFIPSAEESGTQHMTSPFLTEYIEYRDPNSPDEKLPHHYGNANEAIQLIHSYGGLAILAHPYGCCHHLRGYDAVEVYNAHPAYQYFVGKNNTDRNVEMVAFWDQRLMIDPTIYGVAVNDWYGPWMPSGLPRYPASIIDSGKTIVLSPEVTPDAFRDAVESGAMLAVRDLGETKDRFPVVQSIAIEEDTIRIDATDMISWIVNGQPVATGPELDVRSLPQAARYVRAEIQNADGSTVYTQPWAIRPASVNATATFSPGDADQDGDFDQTDLVKVQVAAKYLTGHTATWGEGDWNGTAGVDNANPPIGDGVFNQLDIVAALNRATYLKGLDALAPSGAARNDQKPMAHDDELLELLADTPIGGDRTFLVRSFESGDHLAPVPLAYVPEPSAAVLLILGLWTLMSCRGFLATQRNEERRDLSDSLRSSFLCVAPRNPELIVHILEPRLGLRNPRAAHDLDTLAGSNMALSATSS